MDQPCFFNNLSLLFMPIRGIHCLLTKISLFNCLEFQRKLFPEAYGFYPPTWFLPHQYDPWAAYDSKRELYRLLNHRKNHLNHGFFPFVSRSSEVGNLHSEAEWRYTRKGHLPDPVSQGVLCSEKGFAWQRQPTSDQLASQGISRPAHKGHHRHRSSRLSRSRRTRISGGARGRPALWGSARSGRRVQGWSEDLRRVGVGESSKDTRLPRWAGETG